MPHCPTWARTLLSPAVAVLLFSSLLPLCGRLFFLSSVHVPDGTATEALRIEVNGYAKSTHPAEQATLHLDIHFESHSQRVVSAKVPDTSSKLQQLFQDLSTPVKANDTSPVSSWSMSQLSSSYYKNRGARWGADKTFHMSTSFSATFLDFARLSYVTKDMAATPHVSIGYVDWQLTEATKSRLLTQTRKSAAAEALSKAKSYAEALLERPLSSVIALHMKESPGTNPQRRIPLNQDAFHMHDDLEAGPMPAFEPEECEISAYVKAVFEAR